METKLVATINSKKLMFGFNKKKHNNNDNDNDNDEFEQVFVSDGGCVREATC